MQPATVFTIYCHTCRITGKKYVGQTRASLHARWVSHVRTRAITRTPFARAIHKYGPETFGHEVLEIVRTSAEANVAERKWIRRLRTLVPSGYNLDVGGGERPRHPQTIAKIRAAALLREASMTRQEKSVRAAKINASMTAEQRSARARAGRMSLSPKRRTEISRLAAKAQTPEQRRASAQQISPEERSDRVRRGWAASTPQQRATRAELAKRAWTPERRAQIGEAASRRAQSWWNSLSREQREAFVQRRAEAIRRGIAAQTFEERSVAAKKSAETRRLTS